MVGSCTSRRETSNMAEHDIAVIGGGLVGSAIAWGLAGAGKRVALLDEGDIAFRASRGNFALVWVQSKGLGMPEYARWTRASSDAWAGFAQELREETGIDVAHQRPGGFSLALSEAELERRDTMLKRLPQPVRPALRDSGPHATAEDAAGYRARGRRRRLLPARRPRQLATPAARAAYGAEATQRVVSTGAQRRRHRASRRRVRGEEWHTDRRSVAHRADRRQWQPQSWARWSASTCRCARSAVRSSSPRRPRRS